MSVGQTWAFKFLPKFTSIKDLQKKTKVGVTTCLGWKARFTLFKIFMEIISVVELTHSFPIHPFCTP